MAFADNLVHSMTVMRRSSDADRLGQPRERWSAVATGVACRATTVRGSERNTERMRETYGVTHRVFLLPTATNVGEDDEVVVVGAGSSLLFETATAMRVTMTVMMTAPSRNSRNVLAFSWRAS